MTLYMPPLTTKRRAANAPSAGLGATRRVFGNYNENEQASGSHYSTIFKGEKHPAQPKPRVSSSTRHNKPHPDGVGFLLQDPATLHDPICDVKTKVDPADTHWWPSRANQDTSKNPVFTKDTISRNDYQRHRDRPKAQTRHGSNPNKMAAQGPVPISNLPNPTGPRLLVEHISYQHGYNSRASNNQPQRGKLHGNFVWDVLHPTSQPNFTNNSSALSARAGQPGRGSDSMRNIMTQDLTSHPNCEVRQNRFPNSMVPLKPISSKIGVCEREIVSTRVQQEGVRQDTTLPPIGT